MAKLYIPLAAAVAAASIALPAAAQPEVTPLDISKAPTTITISIAGKDKAAVRKDVRVAARTVCVNALSNHELAFGDVMWCSDKAHYKAMKRYSAIIARHGFADAGFITLAAK